MIYFEEFPYFFQVKLTKEKIFFIFSRLSTIAPFSNDSSNPNKTHSIPTQQTSDTFLIQDAMVPPNHKDMYVSPFTKPQFKEQLVPLIGAKIREQVEGFLEDVDDGIDFIKNIFTVKQNVVKNIAYKVKNRIPLVPPLISPTYQVDPRLKYKIPDFTPTITTRIRINTMKPYYRYAKTGAISHACDDPVKCEKKVDFVETPKYLNELGADGIKDFEESVLKKLEKIEEKKVEATLGTLVGDVVKGKSYGFHNEWKPVSYHNQYLDTKSAGSGKIKVNSPLHTSFKGTSASVTVVGPVEPYPGTNTYKKLYKKKSKNSQKPAKVKVYPSSTKTPAYGSIQEIIASTAGTGNNREPLYDNHITHSKPETGFTPLLFRPDDSTNDASKDSEVSVKKSKRKLHSSRTTAKPPSTTTDNTATSTRTNFKWPKVSSSDHSVPSESKRANVYIAAQSKHVKRVLPERLTVTSSSASGSDILPAVTKSPFVDKVRKTGYRGKVKFSSLLNET